MGVYALGHALRTEECEAHHSRRVKRRQDRGRETDQSEQPMGLERMVDDLILAEEPAQEGEPRERERTDDEEPKRPGQYLSQTAEVTGVDDPAHGVHDAARAEKEKRLEERVGEQMKHGRVRRVDAQPEEHVSQLADRRIGEDSLEVGLGQRDRRREQRRTRADDRDDRHCDGRRREDRAASCDHIDAGGDHCGRMDQRGDRRRTLHRVGQPHVQRELGTLAAGPAKQQERDRRDPSRRDRFARGEHAALDHVENGLVFECAEREVDEQNPESESEVADAVDEERLLRGGGGRGSVVVETDEQIAAETDRLPTEIEQQEVAAEHEGTHGEYEQAEKGEETFVSADRFVVLAHVVARVDYDEQRHPGDREQHDRRERVDEELDLEPTRAGSEPVVERNLHRVRTVRGAAHDPEDHHGKRECHRHAGDDDPVGVAAQDGSPERTREYRADKRCEEDQDSTEFERFYRHCVSLRDGCGLIIPIHD